jgi:hypothetical protein
MNHDVEYTPSSFIVSRVLFRLGACLTHHLTSFSPWCVSHAPSFRLGACLTHHLTSLRVLRLGACLTHHLASLRVRPPVRAFRTSQILLSSLLKTESFFHLFHNTLPMNIYNHMGLSLVSNALPMGFYVYTPIFE